MNQNRFLSAPPPTNSPGTPAGPQAMPPQGAAQGNSMMPSGPLMAPGGQPMPQTPPPMPSAEDVKKARVHMDAVTDALSHVVAIPNGKLTKKDVFDAASEMLAKGAFPGNEARQSLIVELAKLPDDEPSLRKALGALFMQVATNDRHLAHAERLMAAQSGAPGNV